MRRPAKQLLSSFHRYWCKEVRKGRRSRMDGSETICVEFEHWPDARFEVKKKRRKRKTARTP